MEGGRERGMEEEKEGNKYVSITRAIVQYLCTW